MMGGDQSTLSSSLCPALVLVFWFFFSPKETRALKEGGSWRCAVVQLLKQVVGRVEQLCALHSMALPQLGAL